jgi:hypothetical protein
VVTATLINPATVVWKVARKARAEAGLPPVAAG